MAATSRNQTVAFFVLTYAISWTLWMPVILAGAPPSSPLLVLVLLGSFGPTLAAMVLTVMSDGKIGLKRLLGRLLRWRVGLRWYALVLLGPPAVALVAAVLAAALGGPSWGFGGAQIPEGLPAPLAALLLAQAFLGGLVLGGPLGEEVGWRGYALPRMQGERGALTSALILGAVWAFWHLPLFFVAGTVQFFLPFVPFVVGFVSLSVVFSWAYNGSGGSILICLLLHSVVNFSAGVLAVVPVRASDTSLPFYVYTALILLAAVAVATLTGRRLAVERSDTGANAGWSGG